MKEMFMDYKEVRIRITIICVWNWKMDGLGGQVPSG